MHAQNTARRVLRQLKYFVPQAGDVEIVWMEPDDHQVGLLTAQKLNDCIYRLTFDEVILQFDAVNVAPGCVLFLEVPRTTAIDPASALAAARDRRLRQTLYTPEGRPRQ